MGLQAQADAPIRVAVENVGGIDRSEVGLRPGVCVLTGRNATNRTSFLQAIMAALGSERASLKGDAETGRVELEFDGDRYERHLERRNGGVAFDGHPYLDDPELADLFAFLLESNEARRAVGRGDDLRELIMRPIDTAEIQREIVALEAEREELADRLEDLDRIEGELPGLEERRVSLDDEIASVEAELAEVRDEIESLDVDVDVGESRSRREEVADTFAELRSARTDLEDVEFDLETERESERELEREREELEAAREDLRGADAESLDHVEGRIRELRERKRSLQTTLSELQNVIGFNEERLEQGGLDVEGALDADQGGEVTDRLVDTGETVCWTCGSAVERERIESTLEHLQAIHRDTLDDRNQIDDQLETLAEREREIRDRERRREEIERRLGEVDDALARHDDRIADLEAERERIADRVDALEAETESFDDTDYSEVLERHRDANELELELDQLRDEREEIADRIDEIEDRLAERDGLAERRESLADDLTELRTRVDRIEGNAVEAFNDHVEAILSILDYENVERIWIERRETDANEPGAVGHTAFDLHVVRASEDGRAYEDTVDHLSESEREVTGLVFALAGYLVHDVYEAVPFVLLDSLEAVDSERIAELVGYFEEYADCLLVALLPEDADALPEDYHYVGDI